LSVIARVLVVIGVGFGLAAHASTQPAERVEVESNGAWRPLTQHVSASWPGGGKRLERTDALSHLTFTIPPAAAFPVVPRVDSFRVTVSSGRRVAPITLFVVRFEEGDKHVAYNLASQHVREAQGSIRLTPNGLRDTDVGALASDISRRFADNAAPSALYAGVLVVEQRRYRLYLVQVDTTSEPR
jgi:hypothetical protein